MLNKLNSYYVKILFFIFAAFTYFNLLIMSLRRLNFKQVCSLTYRVLSKSRAMIHRACPSNHWSFRRYPSAL